MSPFDDATLKIPAPASTNGTNFPPAICPGMML